MREGVEVHRESVESGLVVQIATEIIVFIVWRIPHSLLSSAVSGTMLADEKEACCLRRLIYVPSMASYERIVAKIAKVSSRLFIRPSH